MNDLASVRRAIARVAPGLGSSPLIPLGGGMDSIAYLVGGEFVFRFPNVPAVSNNYKKEMALLARLNGRVDLNIPLLCYAGECLDTGLTFVGHRLIEGIPLSELSVSGMDDKSLDKLASSLSAFLEQLRIFPIEDALAAGVPRCCLPEDYDAVFERAQKDLYPRVDGTVQQYVERLFHDYLQANGGFAGGAVSLLHGDLWSEHILCDPGTREVCGIIDFGDAFVGDCDFDLMQLYGEYGTMLVSRIVRALGGQPDAKLFDKLRFFYEANSVLDVFIGLDREDEALVEWALAEVRHRANNGRQADARTSRR